MSGIQMFTDKDYHDFMLKKGREVVYVYPDEEARKEMQAGGSCTEALRKLLYTL